MAREAVIYVILYYDIFYYPLRQEDIVSLLSHKYNSNSVQQALAELCGEGLIREHDGFYSRHSKIVELVNQRKISNDRAKHLMKKIPLYAGLLSCVPFVKSIAVSGSLSKGSANASADIDFIVITKHNRLWICKSMVQLLKRVLRLFGKEHYLCANYFISESKTVMDEKNIFIAMELATLLPVYQANQFDALIQSNEWSKKFVANSRLQQTLYAARPFFVLKFFKYLFSFLLTLVAFFLDNALMNLSRRRWRKAHISKFKTEEEFDSSIKIRKNEVKYHLSSFQTNVVKQFNESLQKFEEKSTLSSKEIIQFDER